MTVGDVFPRRNLPGGAEEWGRTLETRTVSAEAQLTALSQELQGQNRNTASSLSVIAQQLQAIQDSQTELLTRRTIAVEEAYNKLVELGVDAIPFTTPSLAAVNFTLTERRQVYLRVTAAVGTLIIHDGTGAIYNPICEVRTAINLTNHTTATTSTVYTPTTSGVGGNSGITGLARTGGRLSRDDYTVLDPGDYTAFYTGVVQQLTGTSASVRIENPKFSVEIMERV